MPLLVAPRAEPPLVSDLAEAEAGAAALSVSAPGGVYGYRLPRMYCWPIVQTLVVTQYRTSPNCQYRPVSAKNGMM